MWKARSRAVRTICSKPSKPPTTYSPAHLELQRTRLHLRIVGKDCLCRRPRSRSHQSAHRPRQGTVTPTQVRVGANGRERQAKLDYIFKQIVNSMFPASYRYLLNTAASSLDVFTPSATLQSLSSNPDSWISELYQTSTLGDWQVEKAATLREGLSQKRQEAIALGVRLREANEALKRQG